jgi:RNA polymerase sigma-70 factor (ECF subfamily)
VAGTRAPRLRLLRRPAFAPDAPPRDAGLRDEADVAAAYDEYGRELYGFALRRCGDHHAAEEAVQETFLRAWRASGRYDPDLGPLRPWLYAILRNVLVDAARAAGARPALTAGEPDEEAGPDGALDAALDGWIVEEALRRLRPDHRTVLVETYYRGRSYADVAAALGIPEGTARSRAFYALKALRLALDEMGWTR